MVPKDKQSLRVDPLKIEIFLKLQQVVLDIEDNSKLLELFLPKVLGELVSLGYPYIFLSAIFIDNQQKVIQTYLTDEDNSSTPSQVTHGENLFSKGAQWEMQVLYGEAAVISDISQIINPSYKNFSKIHSLLALPIQHKRQLAGVLFLGSASEPSKIGSEEIEYAQMITKLIDLAFRLEDAEVSLTKITQQVYEMNAKLHQLDKLKDDFVSVASHELRTPMTAIRSYAWMALHRSDVPLTQKMERYLYRTLISTERLINLVNDMLNVSRIEAGKIEIDPKAFDLQALIKDIVEEVTAKALEKRLQIQVLEHPIPLVFADPDKVHQVLLNLIGNALKFTYPGGIITIDFFSDGKAVEISVKDNGAGISKEDLSKLFHKFARLDNSYVSISTSGGTGLGLYISKSLVELMKGKIWASSEGVDKGSIFTIALPVASEDVLKDPKKYQVNPDEAKPLEPVSL